MFAVIATAVRLFFRHWPVMFALLLLGFALRDFLLWCAVWASNIHAAVGMLVFATVPLSMLGVMVIIMRIVRASLPGPAGQSLDASPPAPLTGHMASVFLPFLAVYAAYEFLDDDRRTYFYRITIEEIFSNFGGDNALDERLPFSLNPTVIIVVSVAIVLRWLIGINTKVKSWRLIGFLQAYLEVIWLTLAVAVIAGVKGPALEWTEHRRLWVWADQTLNNAIDALGTFASFGHQIKTWTGNILASIDTVIIVPLAWLAIGAVIFGFRIKAADQRDEMSRQLQRKWNLLPSALKRVARPLRTDIEDSFTPLARGLRMIRQAGIRAMLLFCLAFVIADGISAYLGEVERMLVGPNEVDVVWAPLSVVFSLINRMIEMTIMICLVAAAVDFVLSKQEPEPAGQPAPAQQTPSPQGQPGSAPEGQPGVVGVPHDPGHPDSGGLGTPGQHEVGRHPVMG
ncbi:collagen-like triple helix repeat-containing protein [Catelliglobosispora koreensis]|uniref:collagen-like triple helix repeat-containing protein n=1 Tax=Catelliglobosispora koreensis TaxID=129052 RepID=UPI00036BA222|nr:collagen-like protein [Catelliglobosispora koreensis]